MTVLGVALGAGLVLAAAWAADWWTWHSITRTYRGNT